MGRALAQAGLPTLPGYRAMSILLLAPLFAAIGGLLYRLRGGWLNDLLRWGQKTQASRALWSVPTGALMWFAADGPLWLLPVLIASNFLSLVMIGTGQYLADVPLRPVDFLGCARTALAAMPLAVASPIFAVAYALSGLLHATLYWLGFRSFGTSQAGEIYVGALSWLLIAFFI